MDRDNLLLTEDKSFLKKVINMIFRKKPRDFKSELIKAIDKAAKEFRAAGKEKEIVDVLRRHSGVKINRLTDLKAKLAMVESISGMNEGFSEWWKEAKTNAYGALAFYPILTMFLELDKVIKGMEGADIRTVLVYLLIWVLVISGKVERSDLLRRGKEKAWKHLSDPEYKGGGAKSLYGEAKDDEIELTDTDLKQLDKAFKRNYDGEQSDMYMYSFRDDGSSGENEEHYLDIQHSRRLGYYVMHTVSDEDGGESTGSLDGMKDKKLSSLISKVLRRMP